MTSQFGKMLREFRKIRGLSQRALASRAEIDTSYISRLERGEREVTSRDLAIRLANILQLSENETDIWLLTAGYASDRLRQLSGPSLSKLMDELEGLGKNG